MKNTKSKQWNSQLHFTNFKNKDLHLGTEAFKKTDWHSLNHLGQEIHLYSKHIEVGCKQRLSRLWKNQIWNLVFKKRKEIRESQ